LAFILPGAPFSLFQIYIKLCATQLVTASNASKRLWMEIFLIKTKFKSNFVSNYVSNDLCASRCSNATKEFHEPHVFVLQKKIDSPIGRLWKPTEVYLRERGICVVGVSVKRYLIYKNITSLSKYTFKIIW